MAQATFPALAALLLGGLRLPLFLGAAAGFHVSSGGELKEERFLTYGSACQDCGFNNQENDLEFAIVLAQHSRRTLVVRNVVCSPHHSACPPSPAQPDGAIQAFGGPEKWRASCVIPGLLQCDKDGFQGKVRFVDARSFFDAEYLAKATAPFGFLWQSDFEARFPHLHASPPASSAPDELGGDPRRNPPSGPPVGRASPGASLGASLGAGSGAGPVWVMLGKRSALTEKEMIAPVWHAQHLHKGVRMLSPTLGADTALGRAVDRKGPGRKTRAVPYSRLVNARAEALVVAVLDQRNRGRLGASSWEPSPREEPNGGGLDYGARYRGEFSARWDPGAYAAALAATVAKQVRLLRVRRCELLKVTWRDGKGAALKTLLRVKKKKQVKLLEGIPGKAGLEGPPLDSVDSRGRLMLPLFVATPRENYSDVQEGLSRRFADLKNSSSAPHVVAGLGSNDLVSCVEQTVCERALVFVGTSGSSWSRHVADRRLEESDPKRKRSAALDVRAYLKKPRKPRGG